MKAMDLLAFIQTMPELNKFHIVLMMSVDQF